MTQPFYLDQLRARAARRRQQESNQRLALWLLSMLLGLASFTVGWLLAAFHFSTQ